MTLFGFADGLRTTCHVHLWCATQASILVVCRPHTSRINDQWHDACQLWHKQEPMAVASRPCSRQSSFVWACLLQRQAGRAPMSTSSALAVIKLRWAGASLCLSSLQVGKVQPECSPLHAITCSCSNLPAPRSSSADTLVFHGRFQ